MSRRGNYARQLASAAASHLTEETQSDLFTPYSEMDQPASFDETGVDESSFASGGVIDFMSCAVDAMEEGDVETAKSALRDAARLYLDEASYMKAKGKKMKRKGKGMDDEGDEEEPEDAEADTDDSEEEEPDAGEAMKMKMKMKGKAKSRYMKMKGKS